MRMRFAKAHSPSQEDTRKVKTQTTHRTLEVRADGEGLVSHAGAYLLVELAERTGLTEALSAEMGPTRKRRSAHDPGVVLRDIAVSIADGGIASVTSACWRDRRPCSGRWPPLSMVTQNCRSVITETCRSKGASAPGVHGHPSPAPPGVDLRRDRPHRRPRLAHCEALPDRGRSAALPAQAHAVKTRPLQAADRPVAGQGRRPAGDPHPSRPPPRLRLHRQLPDGSPLR